MISSDNSGLLEKTRAAIRPLIDDGLFTLESVAYGVYPHDFVVELFSDNLMIFFKGTNTSPFPHTYCYFYIPSKKIWFSAGRLFTAIDIDIPFGIPDPRYTIGSAITRPVNAIDLLDFYTDLGRLCKELKKNWDKICPYLSPETIDKTVNLYSREYSKQGNPVPDIYCSPFPVQEIEPDQVVSDKYLPDFMDIRMAMRSLDKLTKRDTITIHVREGRVDVTHFFNFGSHSKILYHTNKEGSVDVYLIQRPSRNIINKTLLLPEHLEQVVFSLENICRLLNIEYTCQHQGIISDLQDYCHFISENAEKISNSLDYLHLKETYDQLKDCPGNNQDEIISVLANLNELIE